MVKEGRDMPIVAADCETSGLNAKAFLLGCIATEDGKEETFCRKEDMWNYLLAYAESERRRGHNTYCYSHNQQFDLCAYGDIKDNRMTYISDRPFIATRDNLMFLDTVAITKVKLEEAAAWVGMKKGETPEELKTGKMSYEEFHSDFNLKTRTAQYCMNDTKIVLSLVKNIKKRLREEGAGTRRLISAGQVAMSVFFKHVRNSPLRNRWIDNKTGGFIQENSEQDRLTRRACRGARVQALKTGSFEDVWYFDANSLYPSILATMPLPDLAGGSQEATQESLRGTKMGVAAATILKPEGMEGVPVRIGRGKHLELAFPRQRVAMYGTYTLDELRDFEKEGCKIHIQTGYEYDTLEETLDAFVREKYELRNRGGFEKAFWKLILNNIPGKFAQNRETSETIHKNLSMEEELRRQGFELKEILDDIGMFCRKGKPYKSRSYCPLLFAYVTAGARRVLYEKMKSIRREDLIYCDTDSWLLQKGEEHQNKFRLGSELGEWKLVGRGELTVWGKKTYSFGGGKLALAGASRREVTAEMAKSGKVTFKKMIGMKKDMGKAGTFTEETRTLADTVERHHQNEEKISQKRIFIDGFELPDKETIRELKELIE